MSGSEIFYCSKCNSENVIKKIPKREFNNIYENEECKVLYIYCEDCGYEEAFLYNSIKEKDLYR